MSKLTIPAPELTSKQLEEVNQVKQTLTQKTNALLSVIGTVRSHTQKLEEIEGQLEEARNAASRSLSADVHARSQTLLSVHVTAKNLLEEAEGRQRPIHEDLYDAINDANELISKLAWKYLHSEIETRARTAFAPFFSERVRINDALRDIDVKNAVRVFVEPRFDVMRGGEHLLKHANSRLAILGKLADQGEDFFEFEGCTVQ